jgi:protein phosphatase
MADRWYYTHAGQTHGPVTAAALRQLAAGGRLAPTDPVWPEGGDAARAVQAQAAMQFPASPAAGAPVPDWLNDVRGQEPMTPPAAEILPAAGGSPEWLQDVQQAEELEQEFLSIPWDAEPVPADAEPIEAEPVEVLEEVVEPAPAPAPARPAPAAPASAPARVTQAMPAPAPAPPAAVPCRLAVGAATSRGVVRDRNEDSFLVQQWTWSNLDRRHDVALVAIADGMGGHQAGDRASGMVIRTLGRVLAPLVSAAVAGQPADTAPAAMVQALENALQEANRAVLQAAREEPACKGMGATAVVVLVWDGLAVISLAGDCRVYHQRAGCLTQVTRDQTLVARMVELGQLSPQEAANHPRRNEVIQAVGQHGRLAPARYELKLTPGDWLLAVCDGLYAHVEDRTLQAALAQAAPAPAILAGQLVTLANQGGGSDNCTVIAVSCS